MAFPTTGIIDSFDRANEDPLSDGGKWSTPQYQGDNTAKVVSNVIVSSGSNDFPDHYRNDQNYGPDVEVYLSIVTKSSDGTSTAAVTFRVSGENSANHDGYEVIAVAAAGIDTWVVRRVDNDSGTDLGAAISSEFAAGDKVGASMVGDTITVYQYASGAWQAALGTRTDSTYTAAGHIGFWFNATGGTSLNDFGGGTIVAATATGIMTTRSWWGDL